MTELPDLTAVELVAQYRAKTLSPVEVTEAVLTRIEEREPELHALYAYDPSGARDDAKASEARWASNEPLGPIDGVPLTLKENIATRGTPVPLGTAATALVPAAEDAPAAARVRESGAVLLAKTTMPDYGMLTSGLSSFHTTARNPWQLSATPGGSSAGAGAAAAAGYGPLHVGTDIGGSIRLPAGWCGLTGLKPSFGRVPVDPPFLGRVAGPMTRTVADTTLLMSVLSRPDPRDHLCLPPSELDWSSTALPVGGLRVGLQLESGPGLPVDPAIRDAVTAAARAFEAAGAVVEPVEPFLTREMLDGLDVFWRTRAWSDLAALPRDRRAKVLPYIADWAAGGADASGVDVYRGFAQIDVMSVAALRATSAFDVVLSPVCPVAAPPAEWASPTNDPARPFEHIAFTVPYNMSGQPAVSLNCGYTDDGRPIGLQIAGRRFDDLGVLRVAAAYEGLRPPQRPWPIG
ncbi:aspartyl-tRNA(Asn)/glutamyl-tRNA (Gln) amidotransferase subunit A [Amycolatopsis mediterranei S699]|uniref:Aspartyl-tRNA(Asn)/glutamyl-tRNA (Gln) amidotransferase subunit A n=2 Tax=Amycolatopsis mediterranei TaxID=33910 RepID=A0A0H3CUE4_AMYMU|nr:amidase [Amycolatopsis mediterranei]ADJ41898.1 aspartyl-tRNA(Asn)/glutamyl-tRNA (Gln) amidotransferase subunit A [Amycolatopsis mediterranei U32]AEK38569.1 amidase [Amycolatopsis mediterranei S699]AFO73608.1 aspartyl-tRNA(Asn)/glutamyl-tRNA (Gln) amidotransferase subunit A [Amycolatopsis mediterranei S699]AGT80737.1 aspartyl-tRNA(Asn)/glutamyl-tRNA (Gln) amidotransferase subunit A [Amycolatopsis mediterranei RB]KDO09044.1 amidase [Amycolatopsis mediterranei]